MDNALQMAPGGIQVVDIHSTLRMNFMPESFGEAYVQIDVFYGTIAGKTQKSYKGGMWSFAYTPNGRPFIFRGKAGENCEVSTLFDDEEQVVTNEIAGVITTALTIMVVLEKNAANMNDQLHDRLIDLYHNLIGDGREMAEAAGLGREYFMLTD